MTAPGPRTARALGGASLVGAAVIAALETPSWSAQLWLAAPAIALLGLPHGAIDLLRIGRPSTTRREAGRFVAGYLAAAALAVLAWWASPPVALAAFLVISVLHFAETESRGVPETGTLAALTSLARGAVPVVAVSALHPEEVTRLFAVLLGREASAAAAIQSVAAQAFPGLVAIVAFDALRAALRPVRPPLARILLGPAILATAALPPLLAFTVYFCGWHAPVHTAHAVARRRAAGEGQVVRRMLRFGAAPWAASVAAAVAVGLWLPGAATEATLRVVFIGLAALTLPHVLLSLGADRGTASWVVPAEGSVR